MRSLKEQLASALQTRDEAEKEVKAAKVTASGATALAAELQETKIALAAVTQDRESVEQR